MIKQYSIYNNFGGDEQKAALEFAKKRNEENIQKIKRF